MATGGRPHPGLYGDGCHRRTVCPGTPRQSHLSCHSLRGRSRSGSPVTFFHSVSHRVCASCIISQTWHHPTYPGTCCHCLFLPCFVSGRRSCGNVALAPLERLDRVTRRADAYPRANGPHTRPESLAGTYRGLTGTCRAPQRSGQSCYPAAVSALSQWTLRAELVVDTRPAAGADPDPRSRSFSSTG